jgi:excisionase family DNA binding protein
VATFITVKQVADCLGLGESTVWNHVKNGVLPRPYKIGQLSRWDAEELREYIKSELAGSPNPKRSV